MSSRTVRIATRSSQLALWQADHVAALLKSADESLTVEIVHIRTEGDQNQQDPLRQFGGTGVFTREVQTAVLDRRCDIAVHSLKDLPTESAAGLTLAAVPGRAPRCDALIMPEGSGQIASVDRLPHAARIGTGSPRRQAQLLHARSDLQMLEIRGNVETRLRKLDSGDFDAIVLAEAGLRRLGLASRISLVMEPPTMFPAIGQGALGLECREDDEETQHVLSLISNAEVTTSITAERALLRELRAGCHAPLGAWAELTDSELSLTGVLLSTDGVHRLEATCTGNADTAAAIGIEVAQRLLAQGGEELVAGN
jgi:hydroxymethylbilane synthase